jgi:hypothetical protein
MAKSDSFFIRASVDDNSTTFNQASIDLGAYVDALGKSVLRIHNVAIRWTTPQFPGSLNPGANATGAAAWQLTTQSQAALVDMTDKSLISSGNVSVSADAASTVTHISEVIDISPQQFTQGYLVGVEQIYLGFDQNVGTMCDGVQIMLECSVESLSASAAMSLALSQQ